MWTYTPPAMGPKPALVVVLHGCAQTAQAYADGAGWLALAERHGFVVLCPEQVSANNPNGCFNWFLAEDQQRGRGEAASIHAMVQTTVRQRGVDEERIFVTGLSAGGAMTSVMLAAYPETFAGGGVVAGLAYGAAETMPAAFGAMFQCVPKGPRALGDKVRAASTYQGPWPRVSIWHGGADHTVVPANGDEVAKQWAEVHGASPQLDVHTTGRVRLSWAVDGETVVELHRLSGMAHGTPLSSRGEDACGAPGPFLIEAGVSSSLEMLRFWGLAESRLDALDLQPPPPQEAEVIHPAWRTVTTPTPNGFSGVGADIEAVITKALRSAGLMPH
jgi:feruloyl esterase